MYKYINLLILKLLSDACADKNAIRINEHEESIHEQLNFLGYGYGYGWVLTIYPRQPKNSGFVTWQGGFY